MTTGMIFVSAMIAWASGSLLYIMIAWAWAALYILLPLLVLLGDLVSLGGQAREKAPTRGGLPPLHGESHLTFKSS